MIRFVKDESGAVTVDWVVLTAAIVGIAIAVLTVIAIGINTSATNTTTQLNKADSVAGLIGKPNASPFSTLDDYIAAHGGDTLAILDAIVADTPAGYEFDGKVDSTTGAPVYYNGDANTVSVAGQESDATAYFEINDYVTYP